MKTPSMATFMGWVHSLPADTHVVIVSIDMWRTILNELLRGNAVWGDLVENTIDGIRLIGADFAIKYGNAVRADEHYAAFRLNKLKVWERINDDENCDSASCDRFGDSGTLCSFVPEPQKRMSQLR